MGGDTWKMRMVWPLLVLVTLPVVTLEAVNEGLGPCALNASAVNVESRGCETATLARSRQIAALIEGNMVNDLI